jgi:hypothetical protein
LVLLYVIVNSPSILVNVCLYRVDSIFVKKETLVTKVVKKGVKPDFKPLIPYVPEKENENEQGENPVAVKLHGYAIPNPTTDFLPLFYQSTIEHFFKWVLALKTNECYSWFQVHRNNLTHHTLCRDGTMG